MNANNLSWCIGHNQNSGIGPSRALGAEKAIYEIQSLIFGDEGEEGMIGKLPLDANKAMNMTCDGITHAIELIDEFGPFLEDNITDLICQLILLRVLVSSAPE